MGPVVCEPFLTQIVDPLYYTTSSDQLTDNHPSIILYESGSKLPAGFELAGRGVQYTFFLMY